MNIFFAQSVAGLILATLLCGCTVRDALETLEPTPFIIHPERLTKPENTPFSLAWRQGGMDGRQYDRLVVLPVRTDMVRGEQWVYSASAFIRGGDAYCDRVRQLATYLQNRLETKFAERSDSDATVIGEEQTSPLDRTLTIELSLAEVNFGDPLVYGSLLAVPVPAVANLSTAVKSPSIIVEARIVDGQTEELVTELVDRRFPQIKIVDVNRLTVMSAAHEMSDAFVDDLIAALYRKPGERVRGEFPFSLLPW